ncbi:MAG: NifB/NifX family molybdenum-iron cluster-binding protein [Aminipila sp.]
MKIAIPVNESNINTTICMSFGRTPYFLIHDTNTNENIFLDNQAIASEGGAGIKAAQLIVDNKVDVLLTPRCGGNAAEVLKKADIKIYKTNSDSLMDNINAFKEGKLSELVEIHQGFHNHK